MSKSTNESHTFFHVTKGGERIELKELETRHLKNIMACFERAAIRGVTLETCSDWGGGDQGEPGGGGFTLYGEDALEHLSYSKYREELGRRSAPVKINEKMSKSTNESRAWSIALAAIRYCQANNIDLVSAMPDHFEDETPVSPEDFDLVAQCLNSELEYVVGEAIHTNYDAEYNP